MVFNRLKKMDRKEMVLDEKQPEVKRLENGQMCWVKVFEKNGTWTVEMSGVSAHLRDLKHSYVFPKRFEKDHAISESERMYVDFLATHKN